MRGLVCAGIKSLIYLQYIHLVTLMSRGSDALARSKSNVPRSLVRALLSSEETQIYTLHFTMLTSLQ